MFEKVVIKLFQFIEVNLPPSILRFTVDQDIGSFHVIFNIQIPGFNNFGCKCPN